MQEEHPASAEEEKRQATEENDVFAQNSPRTLAFESSWPRTPRRRLLGRGSFGVVFAVQPGDGRKTGLTYVAKEIPIGSLNEEKRRKAFQEGELLRSLRHEHVVACADIMLTSNNLYIIMERADRGDLAQHLRACKEIKEFLAEATVMGIFAQICCALDYIHSKKILHRDLKPANAFVFGDGALIDCDIKLGDFGLGKLFELTTFEALSTVGSPSYFSPEICKGRHYGRKSDVWALGVILYELTCLEPPFSAKVLPALALSICTSEPKPVRTGYSVSLVDLILALLQKDPAKRPYASSILKEPIVQQALKVRRKNRGQEKVSGESRDGNQVHGLAMDTFVAGMAQDMEERPNCSAASTALPPSTPNSAFQSPKEASPPNHSMAVAISGVDADDASVIGSPAPFFQASGELRHTAPVSSVGVETDSVAVNMSSDGLAEPLTDEAKDSNFEEHFKPWSFQSDLAIYDINFYQRDQMLANLWAYHAFCKNAHGLIVTTSCYTAWHKGGRTNGTGKVIPAIRDNGHEKTKIIFFDDNMGLYSNAGTSNGHGICNLRDIETGEFVEFAEGVNGFRREVAFHQTVVHYSSEYRTVLVHANILDAIAHPDYFTRILSRFCLPCDEVVLHCDVNATILLEDTLQEKTSEGILLSTMFSLIEACPEDRVEFVWDNQPPFVVQKKTTLKKLVQELFANDKEGHNHFWTKATCQRFLTSVSAIAQLFMLPWTEKINERAFWSLYEAYSVKLEEHATVNGIALSFFECYKALRKCGHKLVVNSFGVDTHKVILNMKLRPEEEVVYVNVNYDMWSERDAKVFRALFEHEAKVAPFSTNSMSLQIGPEGVLEVFAQHVGQADVERTHISADLLTEVLLKVSPAVSRSTLCSLLAAHRAEGSFDDASTFDYEAFLKWLFVDQV